jgi:hypothetical protein
MPVAACIGLGSIKIAGSEEHQDLAKATLDQLKHRSWATREAALKELKACSIPESGSDYELREMSPGSWQLADRTELFDDHPAPKRKAPAKKKAATAKKDAVVDPPHKGKGPSPTGKSAEAAKLLFRANGATKKEIVAVTEWSFGVRYIHRLAGVHRAEVVTLGEDHWRLVKK